MNANNEGNQTSFCNYEGEQMENLQATQGTNIFFSYLVFFPATYFAGVCMFNGCLFFFFLRLILHIKQIYTINDEESFVRH